MDTLLMMMQEHVLVGFKFLNNSIKGSCVYIVMQNCIELAFESLNDMLYFIMFF